MPLVTASLVTVETKGLRGHSDAICVEGESHTHMITHMFSVLRVEREEETGEGERKEEEKKKM